MSTAYDAAFFSAQSDKSRRSAERVVPLVMDALAPTSVVDVGCGVGTWLAVFASAGVDRVVGLDGDYVDRSQLQIPEAAFVPTDLRERVALDERFDLAVSLEVAEHLPPERSESFVADLVTLAPSVLFSAAIPEQSGTDHINERWQDEWVALFAEHGYDAVDLVRPAVWDDEAVAPWYAQNTFLFTREPIETPARLPTRIVHPRLFEPRIAHERAIGLRPRTLGELSREAPGAIRRSMRHRLSR